MNVVIYSRVSSQSARQSTDRQVADLQKLAADRGYTVCAVFEEKISGCKAIDERHVLLGCLDFCIDAQNHVDMLLVTEVSRLGRSTLGMLKALDMLHKHKVSVYIQNLNIELLPDSGRAQHLYLPSYLYTVSGSSKLPHVIGELQ